MRRTIEHFLLPGFVLFLAIAFLFHTPPSAQAQDILALSKAITGNPVNVEVGQLLEYRLEYSCNNLLGPCGQLTITDALPPHVTYVNTQVAPGYTVNYDAGTRTVTITNPDFQDGTTSEALIYVRVNYDAPGGVTLTNQATGTITTPATTVTTPPVTVTVLAPTERWTIQKTRISPSTIEPALDNDVTYRVSLCSESATGNVSLQNVVMTDTFDPDAILVNPGGGSVVGNTITWTLGNLDIATIQNGCIHRYVVLRYPSGFFTETSSVTNSASATGEYTGSGGSVGIGTGTTSHQFDPPDPDPGSGKSVAGSPVGMTATGRFFFNMHTLTANVPARNLMLSDAFPQVGGVPVIQVTQIQSGRWTPIEVTAQVQYSRDDGGNWTTLGTVDGDDDTSWNAPFPDITDVRWVFSYVDQVTGDTINGVPLGFATANGNQRPEVVFTPRNSVAVPGTTYQNCAAITWTGGNQNPCTNFSIAIDNASVFSEKQRVNGSGDVSPNDDLQFELVLSLTERADAPLIDPTIVDALPDNLEFISWDSVTFSGIPAGEEVWPNLQVLDNYPIGSTTYQTVLIWSWQNPAPPASIDINGNPGVANAWTLNPPTSGSREVRIRFTTRVRPGTSPGLYTNNATFLSDSPGYVCENNSQPNDPNDLDDDNNTAEDICAQGGNYQVRQATVMVSQKWIANPPLNNVDSTDLSNPAPVCLDDGTGTGFTRYPCVAQGFPENPNDDLDDFTYKLVLRNEGNVSVRDYILYDILPYVGDTGSGGVLYTTPRLSEWQPYLIGPVVPADAFTSGLSLVIEYSNSSNPCRTEVFNDHAINDEPAGCVNDWTAAPANFSTVRAFRIRFTGGQQLDSLETMTFTLPMRIPTTAQSGQIAWNSFAQRMTNVISGDRLPTSEPRKVGIIVPERLSIGNRVWFDLNKSGRLDAGDGATPGVTGAAVSLYQDADGNGTPDGAAIATDTTDANGYYLFSDLMPGRYIVGIDNSNFTGAGVLVNYVSSTGVTGDNQVDNNDNGRDTPNATYGVLSQTITLAVDTEPTNDNDVSNQPADGPFSRGNRGEANNNSDLSVDFGFYQPLSLGNRVWLDEGNGGGIRNNGLQEINEPGIAGVTVRLYRDTNGDGSPDGAAIATDTTDTNGYYLFDALSEGQYVVVIDASNFAAGRPLERYVTSIGQNANDNADDRDDNGIDSAAYLTNGIRSPMITLTRFSEPTGETDVSSNPADGPDFRGNQGQLDEDSNLTVDFGFYEPKMSIGNRVWFDANNNALIDTGENGIASVTVRLYGDADANGVPDGAALATDTTDANGYYLFDNLPPGNYLVWIDSSNFGTGAVLESYITSTGSTGDNQTDNNDNGLDTGSPAGGFYSSTIQLRLFQEPSGENTSGNPADGPAGRGNQEQIDADSDLTVDFGFFRAMSIGNRVWRDDGAGGGTRNDGLQNGNEAGIAGVEVVLFRDNAGAWVQAATDTTDAQGYYLFDGLLPGTYRVWINSTNFQGTNILAGLNSSPGNFTDDVDRNDNGLDEEYPSTNGIFSNTFDLTWDTEPETENDPSNNPADGANFRGRFNEANDNSDLSIDFGFDVQPMSIGNRVWFDENNNGLMDAGENGITGVRVRLYQDADVNGIPDSAALTTDTTDANGYYLFDGLPPGSYLVWLDELNFRSGGPLQDLYSSTGSTTTDTDTDDNGIDDATPEIGGIYSNPITLRAETEPAGETDLSGVPDDGPNSRGNNRELDSNSDLTVDFGLYKPMSIGNRVWFDVNDSGTIDGTEAGISGVTVSLYADNDNNGLPDGAALRTDTTDSNGYYLFDNLTPGNFLVIVDAANFQAGGTLQGYTSSTGSSDDSTDRNDNGIDNATPDVSGISSATIVLTRDSEPVNESDLSRNPADGSNSIGNNGETDSNSDVTIDFGFFGARMSLGNRVWLDEGTGTTNNGLHDTGENGIATVRVGLYRDNNSDGQPDGTAIATDTTDANGYYLFENLTPGSYLARLEASNFATGGTLAGYRSSTGDTADDTDRNDNGVDTLNPAVNGIVSQTITLTVAGEPENETDLSGNPADGSDSRGNNGESDNSSDLTIDFGLYRVMSLGNRVWFDGNNNGLIDFAETGTAGVRVSLYRDNDNNGVPDGAAVATDTTDTNGYYLFDGIPPGRYVVGVDANNFQPGGVLVGYSSSTGSTPTNADNNDNGIDNPDPAANGVLSNTITLTMNLAPGGEIDLSRNPADGPNSRGNNGETDSNSDLTVDFGFFGAKMSLGNRVWFDDGTGGGILNNGLQDGGETGVANIRVSLYRDANSDGIPDGTAVALTTTDTNGYYIFDNLSPGNYLVSLDAQNFQAGGVLFGYTGSTGNSSDDTDRNDNGLDTTAPNLNGILSSTIALSQQTEPSGETDLSGNPLHGPGFIGRNGETDNNSNMTVDFGVYRAMSLGNRVWFDPNDNGLIDNGETGISGVRVGLYQDSDNNGAPDGAALATDITDANGYYLFDGLQPGSYLVLVEAVNFQPGGVLSGLNSSTNSAADNTDRNDNGIDNPAPNLNGIISNTITLIYANAPLAESDTSGDVADGPNFRGRFGETDDNSDLTIDFGFVGQHMSLGNRVWLDDGAGGGNANNGLIDGTEAGIAGVVVNLYADANNDGQPDGARLAVDTTDVGGYYLFDGLAPGNYLVEIDRSNFNTGAPLFALFSSTGSTATDADSDDNGIDTPGAVRSGTIILSAASEPSGEIDLSRNPDDGPDSRGNNGETDDNSNLTVDFGFVAAFDRGDAPDSYGTLTGSNGPSHLIISTLFMGRTIDNESDGQPAVNADGDDGANSDDEDGVRLPIFVAGTLVDVEVTVFNNTGSDAVLIGWVDFNANGIFDAGEASQLIVPSGVTEQVVQLPFNVPLDADLVTGGNTYARFRLTTDALTNPTGTVGNGEVEDYAVQTDPPGVSITKTDNRNSIVVGQPTTYTITITNSGLDVLNRNFVDNLPAGFDPATITWTCTATNGASCIAGQPAGTGSNGTGHVNEFIDLPRGGSIVYQITATLNRNYNQPTIVNAAELIPGSRAEDVNGIIFDPPSGTKTGILTGPNVIRWTMTWLNTGGPQAATVSDTLQANQTFAGNLVCQPFGISTTTNCAFVGGAVTWSGTIGTDSPNRVEISFDVTVSGSPPYTNIATMDIGGTQVNATGIVNPGGAGSSDSSTGQTAGQGDVRISKAGAPFTVKPGGLVVWTISVANSGNAPIVNAVVTDSIIPQFEILNVTAATGSGTITGQNISYTIPLINPGETVVITVETRLRTSGTSVACQPGGVFVLENTACVNTGSCTTTNVVCEPPSLPQTGEVSSQKRWQLPALMLFGALALYLLYRR